MQVGAYKIMRAIIQRAANAWVEVEGETVGRIGKGLMVLVGFRDEDGKKEFLYMLDKLINLRIFEDDQGKMNLSVKDISGQILLVPNFTLYGDCRQGRRPSFTASSKAERARVQFEEFCRLLDLEFPGIQTGQFQADMKVHLLNDGPVTLILDSEKIV